MAYTAEYWKYNAFCARYSCPTIVQEKIAETNDVRKWEGKPPLPPCGGGIDCFCSREKIGQDGKKVCCLCKYPIDPTDCYLNVLAKMGKNATDGNINKMSAPRRLYQLCLPCYRDWCIAEGYDFCEGECQTWANMFFELNPMRLQLSHLTSQTPYSSASASSAPPPPPLTSPAADLVNMVSRLEARLADAEARLEALESTRLRDTRLAEAEARLEALENK